MILEAFSKYLQTADQKVPTTWVLARWLWERLNARQESAVDKVLHTEIVISVEDNCLKLRADKDGPVYGFKGVSNSGNRLLKSLYEYALSFEQQKWTRWVHTVKASDFNEKAKGLD